MSPEYCRKASFDLLAGRDYVRGVDILDRIIHLASEASGRRVESLLDGRLPKICRNHGRMFVSTKEPSHPDDTWIAGEARVILDNGTNYWGWYIPDPRQPAQESSGDLDFAITAIEPQIEWHLAWTNSRGALGGIVEAAKLAMAEQLPNWRIELIRIQDFTIPESSQRTGTVTINSAAQFSRQTDEIRLFHAHCTWAGHKTPCKIYYRGIERGRT